MTWVVALGRVVGPCDAPRRVVGPCHQVVGKCVTSPYWGVRYVKFYIYARGLDVFVTVI